MRLPRAGVMPCALCYTAHIRRKTIFARGTFIVPVALLLAAWAAFAALRAQTVSDQSGTSDDSGYAAENFLDVTVLRVYDGDTLFVDIPNVPEVFGKNIGVRIAGVDAPEIRGRCESERRAAAEARDFVESSVREAARVDLTNVRRDKYFRILADVVADGVNISEALLARGYAYAYDGGTKASWCDLK